MAIPEKKFDDPEEDWLITYADAITLLMAFFVMLLTFSKFDIPAFEEAAAAIKSTISGREETSPVQLLKIDVENVVYNMQADQAVKVSTDKNGVLIELSSSAFYKPGSADIREEALPVLENMAQTLLAPRYQLYAVDIEGHTDNDPISTELYPSNWELSTNRASRVVRFLIAQGMEPFRMRATGFADTVPKAPNEDLDGQPNLANKAVNRRVAIRIYPMSSDAKEEFKRKLDALEELKTNTAAKDRQSGAIPQAPGSQEGPQEGTQQGTPAEPAGAAPDQAQPEAAPPSQNQ